MALLRFRHFTTDAHQRQGANSSASFAPGFDLPGAIERHHDGPRRRCTVSHPASRNHAAAATVQGPAPRIGERRYE
jgi:hypothetical protein